MATFKIGQCVRVIGHYEGLTPRPDCFGHQAIVTEIGQFQSWPSRAIHDYTIFVPSLGLHYIAHGWELEPAVLEDEHAKEHEAEVA